MLRVLTEVFNNQVARGRALLVRRRSACARAAEVAGTRVRDLWGRRERWTGPTRATGARDNSPAAGKGLTCGAAAQPARD